MGAITQAMAAECAARGVDIRLAGARRPRAREGGTGRRRRARRRRGDRGARASSPTSIRSSCSRSSSRREHVPDDFRARIEALPLRLRHVPHERRAVASCPSSPRCRARRGSRTTRAASSWRRRSRTWSARISTRARAGWSRAADRRDADPVDGRRFARAAGHARREPLLPARAPGPPGGAAGPHLGRRARRGRRPHDRHGRCAARRAFAASVLGRRALSPLDLEREFGLVGGDIFHGALSLDQLFSARPVLGNAELPHAGEGAVPVRIGRASRRRRHRHPGPQRRARDHPGRAARGALMDAASTTSRALLARTAPRWPRLPAVAHAARTSSTTTRRSRGARLGLAGGAARDGLRPRATAWRSWRATVVRVRGGAVRLLVGGARRGAGQRQAASEGARVRAGRQRRAHGFRRSAWLTHDAGAGRARACASSSAAANTQRCGRACAARRTPRAVARRRAGVALLHERHHRPPERRGDHARATCAR